MLSNPAVTKNLFKVLFLQNTKISIYDKVDFAGKASV